MSSSPERDLAGFRMYLSDKGKQPSTIDSYTSDVKGFLAYLDSNRIDPNSIDANTVLSYQFQLESTKVLPNSVRRKAIGVRQYYRFLVASQNILTSPLEYLPIPRRQEKLGFRRSIAIVENLLQDSESLKSLKDYRDLAALCLLGIEGLKVSELILLNWSDLFVSEKVTTLAVPGDRHRVIELDELTTLWLSRYRDSWHQNVPEHTPCKMILGFKGRDASLILPSVSRHGIKFMIYELGEQIGLSHLNAEKLRHIAISRLLLKSPSIEAAMRHLGLRTPGNILKHFDLPHDPLNQEQPHEPI